MMFKIKIVVQIKTHELTEGLMAFGGFIPLPLFIERVCLRLTGGQPVAVCLVLGLELMSDQARKLTFPVHL